jgi:hypothetical protein
MTKKRRPLVAISAVTLALGFGLTGCGRTGEPTVATAGPSAKTSAGAGTGSEASPIKFSQCMRAQGISWFPDPQPDGGLVVSEPEGDDHTKYAAAQEACKKYDPSGSRAGPADPADIAKMRKASQCMRDHGVENWPDPDANGSVHIDEKSGIKPDDPTVQKAQRECRKYFPTGSQK